MFDVFQNVLAEVQSKVSDANHIWFKDIRLISLDKKEGVATIGTPNVFISKQLDSKYRTMLMEAFKNNGIELKQIDFTVKSSNRGTRVRAREVTSEDGIKLGGGGRVNSVGDYVNGLGRVRDSARTASTGLNSKYTLDNFVVGSSNELAAGVAKLIVAEPGKKNNPFFLYGGPGLGKTHLVQGIGNAIVEKYPDYKVLYATMNHFYSEFINSIKANKPDAFVRKYQKLDVLIIDDFQMIIGKDRSQEEFFNIFNDLHQANKQIIITCDRLPKEIKTLDVRLSSRLESAGAYDISFPGFEDRCAILKAKAEYLGQEIEDAAIEFIAENVKTNVRELEGEFQKIMLTAEIKGMTPLELINEGYVSGSVVRRTRAVTSRQVVEKVAKYYNLTVVEMTGKSRVAHIKTARQVAMYLLSKELGMSTTKIAPEVGVKDHTTVMNGIRKIETDQKTNLQLRDQVEQIKEAIYA
ncbi:chromosomal replication initiator protein DnaA [Candidatus Saccharibacteria bacterium]|nr:chromosomal replication initiator protein DnaA [Candidatus Saccharibacteria bacterium]